MTICGPNRPRPAGRAAWSASGSRNYTEQTAHALTEYAKRMLPITLGFDSATVRMDPQGTVWIAVGIHSHGQGLETTLAQIAADELGVSIDDIQVVYGDTQVSPYGMGTFASRGVIGGGAVIGAARTIRQAGAHRRDLAGMRSG